MSNLSKMISHAMTRCRSNRAGSGTIPEIRLNTVKRQYALIPQLVEGQVDNLFIHVRPVVGAVISGDVLLEINTMC